jgi:hypothetical protein
MQKTLQDHAANLQAELKSKQDQLDEQSETICVLEQATVQTICCPASIMPSSLPGARVVDQATRT